MTNQRKLKKRSRAISLARAEASSLVVKEILSALPPETSELVLARALREAVDTGVPDVLDELLWLSDHNLKL